VPLFLEEGGADPGRADDGETIGLRLSAGGGEALFFIPGCAAMTDALRERLRGAACVLFDGTLWRDDEMGPRRGGGEDRGAHGAHERGRAGRDAAAFEGLGVRRRVLIH
jgi:pyrroloquinoline quinone biosynthesis protein B